MTVSERRIVTAYQVTFYHDEPEEASVESFTLTKPYLSEAAAVRAARKVINDHWQSASIHKGEWHAGEFGVRPDWFEDDEDATPLRVGPDWTDR